MPIKKLIIIFFLAFFLIAIGFTTPFVFSQSIDTSSGNLDSINKQLADLTDSLNKSIAATKPLQTELDSLKKKIESIKAQVAAIEIATAVKKKEIDKGYKELEDKEKIISEAIRDYYIKSYYNSPFLIFLSSTDASEMTQLLAYQRAKTEQDKAIITNIALSLVDLENKKASLEQEQKWLVATKADLDVQSGKLDEVVKGAVAYQKELSGKIAQLTAQQQQIVAQKQGTLGLPTSVYSTTSGCSSDLTNGKNPGFSPRVALFTFGAPHRVGMNQYGAKGRAEAGQDYRAILSFYYPNTEFGTGDQGTSIHVKGTNEYGQSFDESWPLEEYLKHVYEIMTYWPAESLKAQAVVSRTHALRLQADKGYIEPNQSNQVVKKELNSDAWVQAVNATAGQILTNGGAPISAWFSATSGGYTFSSGSVWSVDKPWTKNSLDASGPVNSFEDLKNNAYDKSSPWFYCDWGGRSQYAGTAWLKPEELADIANVILLARFSDVDKDHLYQTDKPNPTGKETWNADKVKSELASRGGSPVGNGSDASVSVDFGSGKTNSVTVGGASFDAAEFKNWFNLRAPANIQIVGPLYNIEKQ